MSNRTCSIEGCTGAVQARGWCTKHYQRWRRFGNPEARTRSYSKRRPARSSLEERFWSNVDIPTENPLGCWRWTAARDGNGYGRLNIAGQQTRAHRVSYELSMGTIGRGLEIDHLCRNTWCVNPLHLQAVPSSVNQRRKPSRAVTQCPQGHPYLGDNLREYNGRRYCVTCSRERSRAHYLSTKVTVS